MESRNLFNAAGLSNAFSQFDRINAFIRKYSSFRGDKRSNCWMTWTHCKTNNNIQINFRLNTNLVLVGKLTLLNRSSAPHALADCSSSQKSLANINLPVNGIERYANWTVNSSAHVIWSNFIWSFNGSSRNPKIIEEKKNDVLDNCTTELFDIVGMPTWNLFCPSDNAN